MALTKEVKEAIVKKYARNEKDTGSVEVQCAIMTERIKNLAEHLKTHQKDFSSRNGLMMLVARRKRLLKYLSKKSPERYTKLVETLGLKANRNN